MATGFISKCALAAGALALALALAPTASVAQATKQAMSAKPAAGACTGYCNAFKWCHQRWRSSISGHAYPTLALCKEGVNCPPKC